MKIFFVLFLILSSCNFQRFYLKNDELSNIKISSVKKPDRDYYELEGRLNQLFWSSSKEESDYGLEVDIFKRIDLSAPQSSAFYANKTLTITVKYTLTKGLNAVMQSSETATINYPAAQSKTLAEEAADIYNSENLIKQIAKNIHDDIKLKLIQGNI